MQFGFSVKKVPALRLARLCKQAELLLLLDWRVLLLLHTEKVRGQLRQIQPQSPSARRVLLDPKSSGVRVRLKAKLSCQKSKQVLERYQD